MLKGMTLKKRKNRPNDPHVPWPASKHSVVRFSHHQVILPQHTKVRMLGRASEAAENPPTVQGENDDLAKHTKNTGNFQFTSMKWRRNKQVCACPIFWTLLSLKQEDLHEKYGQLPLWPGLLAAGPQPQKCPCFQMQCMNHCQTLNP